jgi:hypothetical protein
VCENPFLSSCHPNIFEFDERLPLTIFYGEKKSSGPPSIWMKKLQRHLCKKSELVTTGYFPHGYIDIIFLSVLMSMHCEKIEGYANYSQKQEVHSKI